MKNVLANKTGKKLLCSVMVDDIAIRKFIRWDGKKYNGFVTYSERNAKDIRSNEKKSRATEAMVIIVVCLNEHWKVSVAYHFIHGLSGKGRAYVISECLTKLLLLASRSYH